MRGAWYRTSCKKDAKPASKEVSVRILKQDIEIPEGNESKTYCQSKYRDTLTLLAQIWADLRERLKQSPLWGRILTWLESLEERKRGRNPKKEIRTSSGKEASLVALKVDKDEGLTFTEGKGQGRDSKLTFSSSQKAQTEAPRKKSLLHSVSEPVRNECNKPALKLIRGATSSMSALLQSQASELTIAPDSTTASDQTSSADESSLSFDSASPSATSSPLSLPAQESPLHPATTILPRERMELYARVLVSLALIYLCLQLTLMPKIPSI